MNLLHSWFCHRFFFAVLLMMPWKFTGFFVLICFLFLFFFVFRFFVCCTQELYLDCIQSRDETQPSAALAPFIVKLRDTESQSLIATIIWQLNESWLELVLQEEKIVRGGNCDNVFRWVPCGMEDFFVEI